jgi:hypothetical protein
MSESKENAEWARLVYRTQMDAIEAVKRRQWAATNYILLIFVAIIGFAKLLNNSYPNPCTVIEYFLLLVPCVISIMGIYHIMDMHLVMIRYRVKALNIAKKYEIVSEFDVISDEDIYFYNYFYSITVFFCAMVGGGLFLVTIFVEKSLCINLPIFPYPIWFIALIVYIIFALVFYRNIKKKAKEELPESLKKKSTSDDHTVQS